MLEHATMARMRATHPDWIWNRSDTHAFVAVPGSHESFKTIVEPGNSFSPGPLTYGVSTWVFVDGVLHAPEEKPLAELVWRFRDGYLPILIAQWAAGPLRVESRLFSDGDVARGDLKTYLTVTLTNPGPVPIHGSCYLVLRSFGAAGGPLHSLALAEGNVLVNGAPLVYPDSPPDAFGTVSYAATGTDISLALRRGELPTTQGVDDESGWASGALEYRLDLAPGQSATREFACHLHAGHRMLTWLKPPDRPLRLAANEEEFAARWRAQSPIHLDLPDGRFTEAFFAQLTHLAQMTVANAPRISPLTYPLWWIRDASYIVAALDKGGYHDFAARACHDAVRHDVATGFGAEGDVPGELIWMLSEHALLHHDLAFLRTVSPFLAEKADLLIRMRQATEPIKIHHEYCTHEQLLTPVTDLVCLPAVDGLIVGRMDHHFPTFWVNGFSYLGLRRAAVCARLLGQDGSRYDAEADALRDALRRHAEAHFGENERDVVCALWPTGWAAPDDPLIRARFDEWWDRVRCPAGVHHRERLWTYFEAGEAHNDLLLGRRDRVWMIIEGFLTDHAAPGLYCYSEGERDENSASLLWERTRGWDQIRWVVPNGWTSAELFLLLRDCLVREDGDALVIGSGVPAAWLRRTFAVSGLPSHYGAVSFRYDPVGRVLAVTTGREPPGGVRADLSEPVDLRWQIGDAIAP